MKATYHFSQSLFGKGYQRYAINVEVLGETDKSYKIRLLQPTCNRRCGDVIWVRREHITFPKTPYDCSGEWWNDL